MHIPVLSLYTCGMTSQLISLCLILGFFVARYLYQREFLVISTMVFKIEGSFPCLRLWRREMGREEIDIPLI